MTLAATAWLRGSSRRRSLEPVESPEAISVDNSSEHPHEQERVLVARVWHEQANFRARLTIVDLAQGKPQRSSVVASPDEMLGAVEDWLRSDDKRDEHG